VTLPLNYYEGKKKGREKMHGLLSRFRIVIYLRKYTQENGKVALLFIKVEFSLRIFDSFIGKLSIEEDLRFHPSWRVGTGESSKLAENPQILPTEKTTQYETARKVVSRYLTGHSLPLHIFGGQVPSTSGREKKSFRVPAV
jgi:hypothetical protein